MFFTLFWFPPHFRLGRLVIKELERELSVEGVLGGLVAVGIIPGEQRRSGGSPWRRGWLLTAVFLPGEFHGHRSLAGYSPWGRKELDMSD